MRRQNTMMLVGLGGKERTRADWEVLGSRREARAGEGVRAGAVGAIGRCAEEMSHCVRAW